MRAFAYVTLNTGHRDEQAVDPSPGVEVRRALELALRDCRSRLPELRGCQLAAVADGTFLMVTIHKNDSTHVATIGVVAAAADSDRAWRSMSGSLLSAWGGRGGSLDGPPATPWCAVVVASSTEYLLAHRIGAVERSIAREWILNGPDLIAGALGRRRSAGAIRAMTSADPGRGT